MSFNYYTDDDPGIIGTPFPALETDEIVSRKPEIDQTVRDERGRRRFHGAFTGGFSAGYWNTVGSAEGFTPKIFSSSRKDKYNKSGFESKPEDYMDEEDFGSFGIAPKKISTKDDFVENFTFTSLKDSKMSFDEVIRSVFKPSKESIGKRLFRKMKGAAKLEQNSNYLMDEDDPEFAQKTDQENIPFQSKTNRHGLGYKGMLNQEAHSKPSKPDNTTISATLKGGKKLKISGEAFGYGALEDDDAMDIYSTEDLSQYDFELGPASDNKKKIKNKKAFVNNGNQIQIDGFRKFKENFNLFQNIKQKYAPPIIPDGWKPKMKFLSTTKNKKSRWDNKQSSQTDETIESKSKQQKVLNANLRAVILGENVIHKTGMAKPEAKPATEITKEIHKPTVQPTPVPIKTPLSGYFASKFTRSSTELNDESLTAGLNTLENLTSISLGLDRKKESVDKNKNEQKDPIRSVYEWHPHKILCKRFGVQNPYPQFPDIVGIICLNQEDKSRNMIVRLNSANNNQKTTSLATNIFDSINNNLWDTTISKDKIVQEEKDATSKGLETSVPSCKDNPNQTIEHNLLYDNSTDDISQTSPEESLKQRPSMDIFKSIFASDEESDEDDNENIENKEQEECKKTTSVSTKWPATGIFSGIDFEELKESFDPRINAESSNPQQNNEDGTMDEDEDYGPALPTTPISNVDLASFMKSHHHKKKSKKKSSKHKSKKPKSKKKSKHRKTSSRKRSRSSSLSSDSDFSSSLSDNSDKESRKKKSR